MPVLEEFNQSAATSADWIFVAIGQTFSIVQTGLGVGETLEID
jgi:hypothetical protein